MNTREVRYLDKEAIASLRIALIKRPKDRTEIERAVIRLYRLMVRAQKLTDRGGWPARTFTERVQ